MPRVAPFLRANCKPCDIFGQEYRGRDAFFKVKHGMKILKGWFGGEDVAQRVEDDDRHNEALED